MVGMKAIVRMKKRTVPMSMSELLYKIKSFGARRKLLKYLKRTNLEGYRSLIKELGIRK